MTAPLFNKLDHIAIVVKDTEEALKFYRDTLGLPLILSEEIPTGNVRLTHLDMGNLHLQLVEPLTEDHPLQDHLKQHGEGLHHLCFETDNVAKTRPCDIQRRIRLSTPIMRLNVQQSCQELKWQASKLTASAVDFMFPWSCIFCSVNARELATTIK